MPSAIMPYPRLMTLDPHPCPVLSCPTSADDFGPSSMPSAIMPYPRLMTSDPQPSPMPLSLPPVDDLGCIFRDPHLCLRLLQRPLRQDELAPNLLARSLIAKFVETAGHAAPASHPPET
jgi:hypothetical protein